MPSRKDALAQTNVTDYSVPSGPFTNMSPIDLVMEAVEMVKERREEMRRKDEFEANALAYAAALGIEKEDVLTLAETHGRDVVTAAANKVADIKVVWTTVGTGR